MCPSRLKQLRFFPHEGAPKTSLRCKKNVSLALTVAEELADWRVDGSLFRMLPHRRTAAASESHEHPESTTSSPGSNPQTTFERASRQESSRVVRRDLTPGDVDTEVLHRSYAIARFGPMLVSRWDGRIREERVKSLVQHLAQQCHRYPGEIGLTVLIGEHAGVPDEFTRRMIVRALQEFAPHIRSTAIVLECGGSKAATARSLASLLFSAVASTVPMRVFDQREPAACWQASVMPSLVGSREFKRALNELTQTHRAHREAHTNPRFRIDL